MPRGMYDATCDKCGTRIGWQGELTERPPCPKCGASIPKEVLEREKRVLERTLSGDPEDEVMPFGKYAGKTLGEIAATDILYLDWVVDKCRHPDLKRAVRAVCDKYAHEIESLMADN